MTSADRGPPRIAFRTTAGNHIGFGHLRRCLTLAGAFREAAPPGAAVAFWIDGSPETIAFCAARGFDVKAVGGPEPAATSALLSAGKTDVVIVDAYDVQPDWMARWRTEAGRLAVIDDLADRELAADLVINPSADAAILRYRVPPECALLLGPAYALLRPSFRGAKARPTPASVSRILVTMGGSDPHRLTELAVRAAAEAVPAASLDVLVGPLFAPEPELEARAAREPQRIRLHRGVDDPAALMAEADLAISGGGQTLYELAALGLPAVAVCMAENQEANLAALAAAPTLVALRRPGAGETDWGPLRDAVRSLAADVDGRARMSAAGRALVDGCGASRAADGILALSRILP